MQQTERYHADLAAARARGFDDAATLPEARDAPPRWPDDLNDPSLRTAYAIGWQESAALQRFAREKASKASKPPSTRRGSPMPKNAPKNVKHKPSSTLKLELRNEGKTADDKLKLWEGYAGPVFLGHIVARTASAGMKQLRAIARKQIG